MADAANPYAAPEPPPSAFDAPLLTAAVDPQSAIVAEGMISEADFYAAQRLHRSGRRWALLVWGTLFVVVSGGGVRLFLGAGRNVLLVTLVLFGAYVLVSRFFFLRSAARRIWLQTKSLHLPTRRLISPELIQTITPDSNVTLRWTAYVNYRANDRVTLLYLAEHPRLFTLFSRSMFQTDADWDRFQELVFDRLQVR